METLPIETTYEINMLNKETVFIKQTTVNSCNNQDLINVKGNWLRQVNNLKIQLEKDKKLITMLEGINDTTIKDLITLSLQEVLGERFPIKEKLDIEENQIKNLEKEITNISTYIK